MIDHWKSLGREKQDRVKELWSSGDKIESGFVFLDGKNPCCTKMSTIYEWIEYCINEGSG